MVKSEFQIVTDPVLNSRANITYMVKSEFQIVTDPVLNSRANISIW